MKDNLQPIESPESTSMSTLCEWLAEQATDTDQHNRWPVDQLTRCAQHGVFRWFLPAEHGGYDWTTQQLAEGYLRIGAACLNTTFVVTQWAAAVKRMLNSDQPEFTGLRDSLMAELASGSKHVTVGISHLTTSHRHLDKPVLRVEIAGDELILDGFSPWVTGGSCADEILIGATCPDGQQVLVLVPTSLPGVTAGPRQELVALTASQTGAVQFDQVCIPPSRLVAGPHPNVMASGRNSGTGGIQTSALAMALSRAAIDFVKQQSTQRGELQDSSSILDEQWQQIRDDLMSHARGDLVCSREQLRTSANSLVLRSTQAALVAAKGAGFVAGHPVGRWCREALFFLVWSCPQTVQDANLCELAGIQS